MHTEGERAIVREKESESEGGMESEKKQTCQAHMLQNVQDAAWKETSHPKSVYVYLLSHQTIPAIQSNDIHNTQSNHIFTHREREYKKVQACLGLDTFSANLCPSWGFFKACLVGLTDSCKTQFDYKIHHLFAHDIHSR